MTPSADPIDFLRQSSTIRDRIAPGYKYRATQEAMAEAVTKAISQRTHLIVEAGTGTGKTLAYLLPLIAFAKANKVRVAVSTETRSLQLQIIQKEIPAIEKILDIKIRAELCFGASNYLCKRRLEKLSGDAQLSFDRKQIEDLVTWDKATATGLRFEAENIRPAIWEKVGRDPDDCLGRRCPNYDESFYFLAKERWKEADLLIVNHSLLAAHVALESRLLPEFQILVADEAHRLPETFLSAMAGRVKLTDVANVLRTNRSISKEVTHFTKEAEKWFRTRIPLAPGDSKRVKEVLASTALEKLIHLLQLTADHYSALVDEKEKISSSLSGKEKQSVDEDLLHDSALMLKSKEYALHLAKFTGKHSTKDVLWISQTNDGIEFCSSPLNSGPHMRGGLLDKTTVIFSSATLTSGTEAPFKYFQKEIGSSEVNCKRFESPFNFRENSVIYAPGDLPDPTNEFTFHQECARRIDALLKITNGGAFVLFTSIRSLKSVMSMVQHPNIISQVEHGAEDAFRRFQRTEDAVLFGLSTFWQGVDVPGDKLRLVILVKIPFRVPDEPVLEARIEKEKAEGRNPFATIQLPQAILLMKQGFGRLIRKEDDQGIVAILDPRTRTKSYGREIMDSLPAAQRINDLNQLTDWYSKKSVQPIF